MKHDIDKLLKDWAAGRSDHSDNDVTRLYEQIAAQVRTEKRPVGRNATQRRGWQRIPRTIAYSTAAAMALVIVAVYLARPRKPSVAGKRPVTEQIVIRDRDRSEKRELFAEMNRLFETGLEWIVETEQKVQIRVADGSSTPAAPSQALLLNVLLLWQPQGQDRRETLWKGSIVARSEQVVTVTPDPDVPENTLKLWLYPLNQDGIVVDFDLDYRHPLNVRMSSASHMVTARPIPVFRTGGSSGGKYELYMSAVKLTDTADGPEVEL